MEIQRWYSPFYIVSSFTDCFPIFSSIGPFTTSVLWQLSLAVSLFVGYNVLCPINCETTASSIVQRFVIREPCSLLQLLSAFWYLEFSRPRPMWTGADIGLAIISSQNSSGVPKTPDMCITWCRILPSGACAEEWFCLCWHLRMNSNKLW